MRDYVLLYVNGQRCEIRGEQVFLPLSDYLRYQRRLTGTKVVCAEGDCGACAVLVGRPMKGKEELEYRAITSCIAMVFQLDGVHVVTVEGLAKANRAGGGAMERLHPVQESMVACHGAQCGFCTPGIVVTLAGMCEERVACGGAAKGLELERVRFGLTGNLCRCTGYEAILQAGTSVDCGKVLPLNQAYAPGAMIGDLREAEGTAVEVRTGERVFYKPLELWEACAFKRDHVGCVIVAGGTDVGVLINKGRIEPRVLMAVGGLKEMSGLEETESELIVGATASLGAFEEATRRTLPELHEIMRRHGSPLIRNAGTLAGNIVNGSPIGDTMPALMALNAEVELTGVNGMRRVSMNAFYTGYRKTVVGADELVTRVIVPKLRAGEALRLYKVSKRWDLDISTFTAAFWMKLKQGGMNGNGNGRGGVWVEEARIAYGGVGPVIVRLARAEGFLKGRALSEAVMAQVGEIAREEIAPISDVRSSAEFRVKLAENIPLKLFHEFGNSYNG